MDKIFENSWAYSLKAKIQLSLAALAIFVFFFGLLSYCIVFLFGSSFYTISLPFIFLAATIFFFGRWLSKEIVSPVEKVSLLAKSFERGVSTSIPKTTGSAETDELVQTIARISTLVQKLISSMDEVAGGNLNVVLSQSPDSDRTTQTFQKLLAKVSESIHAKRDMENLRSSLRLLADEAAEIVKLGYLNAKIVVDDESPAEIVEISETLNYLTESLAELVSLVKNAEAQNLTSEIQKTIQTVVHSTENRIQEMNQTQIKLKQIPDSVQKIHEEIFQSSAAAQQSIEKAKTGALIARENLNAVSNIRNRIREAVKNVQHLSEQIQEIGKIAGTVEDLSQRAGLISLNASFQTGNAGNVSTNNGFAVVSEEIKRLAERAGITNKQISTLDKAIQADIRQIETTLGTAVAEIANLSKLSIETGGALDELEKYASKTLILQENMAIFSNEKNSEAIDAFEIFVKGIVEMETSLAELNSTSKNIKALSGEISALRSLAANFKVSQSPSISAQTDVSVNSFTAEYQLPVVDVTVL